MNGRHSNGDDTLDFYDQTTVTGTLHFQKNAFLTLEVTTRDTDFSAFGQIQFIRTEVSCSW